MKKSIFFIGAAAVAGFIGLTAFGGQTKAQQEAEIASSIQNKLDGYRTEMQAGCEEKIAAEAKSTFDTWAAAEAAKPAMPPAKLAGGKQAKKPSKGGKGGKPKVDPLPNVTPPTTDNTNHGRGDATNTAIPGENKKRGDAVDVKTPGSNRKRGDAVKKEGGN